MPRANNGREHTGTLLLRTYDLMDDTALSLPELYAQTGVPFYWLRKFKRREIKHPSVNRVQRLYEFLSGKKLAV